MLDDLIAAFDRQDYRTAAQLLKALLAEAPDHPWLQFYRARLQEVSGKWTAAETIYRQLLRETTNPKLAVQARQGIQRLEAMQAEQQQQAIAQAIAAPNANEPGFLVLEAVTGEGRNATIQNLARVMKLEAYTARLLLPNRGWRLYRYGPVGELQVYGEALRAAGVPTFWASVPQVQAIQVFRVNYFQTLSPQPIVICQNAQDQLGSLPFDWSEVSQRVTGMLPIFEQVLELGYRDRPERKEKTQDYAHFCDLHLPSRHCILRLHDSNYDFQRGVAVATKANRLDRDTIRTNWNALLQRFDRHIPQTPIWSDFTTFGETAADFTVHLLRLQSHIRLSRATDSYWDAAFHLYSGLAFWRR